VESGESPVRFMRHYYDVYALLQRPEVQSFIGKDAYQKAQGQEIPSGRQSRHRKKRSLHSERHENAQALRPGVYDPQRALLRRQAHLSNRFWLESGHGPTGYELPSYPPLHNIVNDCQCLLFQPDRRPKVRCLVPSLTANWWPARNSSNDDRISPFESMQMVLKASKNPRELGGRDRCKPRDCVGTAKWAIGKFRLVRST
jgi:hypothetical protein